MARAEFEEKQFETAFLLELAGGTSEFGRVYSAGQVLEKIVGYDAATAPDRSSAVWRVLQVRRPVGVRLAPPLWLPGTTPSADALPSLPVSLILQFKRPEHLLTSQARQWHLWRRPYFRFAVVAAQQKVLRRLEKNLGTGALVRYAAPAFATSAELEAAHHRRTTVEATGFVKPSDMVRHRIWTYTSPGLAGRANPRAPVKLFESSLDLANLLVHTEGPTPGALIVPDSLVDYVERLARAAAAGQPAVARAIARWRRSLSLADLGLNSVTLDRIASVATISTVVERAGATWILIDGQGP